MKIRENEPLATLTTFGVSVSAEWYIELESIADIENWAKEISREPQFAGKRVLPLGGGSNILFTRDFDGIVLRVSIPGREESTIHGTTVHHLRLGAGEIWHDTVVYCIKQGLYGIENLALIPGNVGAAPMQNIGAYGVEIADAIHSVEYYDMEDKKLRTLSREECRFGYRTSIFKSYLKNHCIITAITLLLSVNSAPVFMYADVRKELEFRGIHTPSPKDVFDVVVAIRTKKLPDPKLIGNAGSFFKNPVIHNEVTSELLTRYPEIPTYHQNDGSVKIPAAWLIDQCGWKGFRRGDAGVSPVQALVLVNYGAATGSEILALSAEIQQSVVQRFGIQLEPEVNIIH